MEKFLYFQNSTSDAMLLSTDMLTEMNVTADDDLTLSFKGQFNVGGRERQIVLSITAHKGKEVMAAITDAIRFQKDPFIVVCDETNNEFLHSAITACESTLTDVALL